ncbi:hypothetical protein HJC23_014096 [Cyclotella cryptica]|uniref:Uncharacterized protein n=1 Tax=Cyclotella cryptica TaxID=29204 RepID=A0ABD3QTT1_9STRA
MTTQSYRVAYLRVATLFVTVVSPSHGFNGLPVPALRNVNRLSKRHRKVHVANVGSNADTAHQFSFHSNACTSYLRQSGEYRESGSRLRMVRNVDLPEALVFYGLESVFDPPTDVTDEHDNSVNVGTECTARLRSGVARILDECQEVGTAALILSESNGLDERELKDHFVEAWANSFQDSARQERLQKLMEGSAPVVSFRCINNDFTYTASDVNDGEGLESSETLFYNLLSTGRSPSPAFLLDSLQSIRIDPRGFGGSSGFARGQWIEPRRSPMTARTVVFVCGDWNKDVQNCNVMKKMPWLSNSDANGEENISSVRDRCAAVRAAGCRIIYL